MICPGFIDAHCHPSGVEELYGVNTNLRTVREIQAAIRQKAENTAPEIWITGFMFDDTKLDRPLTKKDLDEATTDHPVTVAHRGGHALHTAFAGKILEETDAWRIVEGQFDPAPVSACSSAVRLRGRLSDIVGFSFYQT